MKPIFDKNSIFISFEIKNDKQLTSYENHFEGTIEAKNMPSGACFSILI